MGRLLFILPTGDHEYFPAKRHIYGEIIESYAIQGFNIPVESIFEEDENILALQNLTNQPKG